MVVGGIEVVVTGCNVVGALVGAFVISTASICVVLRESRAASLKDSTRFSGSV